MHKRLVDSHLHLQDFDDPATILNESAAAGVSHFICNGESETDWPEVLELARSNSCVIPFFGLHPWFVPDRSDKWISTLEKMLKSIPSGIGEIGLDQAIEPFQKDAQEAVFRAQLELARKLERPVTMHCRRAWGWMMEVLAAESIPNGFQMHAYGGSVELIAPLAEMGAYFSFGGSALWPNNRRANEALRAVPFDRLLIETDAPTILPPEPYRTHRIFSADNKELNHPANLPSILLGIAGILEKSPEELKEQLWENSKQFLHGIID